MDRRGTAPGRAAQPWNPTRLGTTRDWEAAGSQPRKRHLLCLLTWRSGALRGFIAQRPLDR
ncbi:MAG TPA: hypothetical protein PKD38_20330, partial [Nitrospira sp.]|nr:hypothetical protein [Nitrospira sp.]